jgi:AcrR family transcriptional regulator
VTVVHNSHLDRSGEVLKKLPKQERSRALVETILGAATRVLAARPLREITTNHLAEVAGVSIGSLYQYFDSKEAIAQCLLERHRSESIALANQAFMDNARWPVSERYRLVLRELMALHERNHQLHRSLMEIPGSTPATAGGGVIEEHLRLTAALLREDFPGLDSAASRLHAGVLMRSIHAVIHQVIQLPLPGLDGRVVGYFDTFIRSYHAAVAADGGRSSRAAGCLPRQKTSP